MKNLHVARNHSSANEARQKQDTGKEKLNNRNNRNNRSNNNTFVGRVGESEPNVGAHDVRGKMAGWGGCTKAQVMVMTVIDGEPYAHLVTNGKVEGKDPEAKQGHKLVRVEVVPPPHVQHNLKRGEVQVWAVDGGERSWAEVACNGMGAVGTKESKTKNKKIIKQMPGGGAE